jgi:hypothetical protein
VTFRYSQVEIDKLTPEQRMIDDLRNKPIRRRNTQFRLMQGNILAYTFDETLPGWGSPGLNKMPFKQVVDQALENATAEGRHYYKQDFQVASNAVAKVTGDIYETLTSAILWDAATHWNRFMCGGDWPASPRYQRPTAGRSPKRQVAVLNLPRRYDWVHLLEPQATAKISELRDSLGGRDLSMPTSTPDIAIVVLPEDVRADDVWRTPIANLRLPAQAVLRDAHKLVKGKVEPGEIILAMALKSSLRSDRLYQPLYEANVMQLILEGHLGAPRVEFEVHALTAEGTSADDIYRAASLHSAGMPYAHRAVRELYQPDDGSQIIARFLSFLDQRMAQVAL